MSIFFAFRIQNNIITHYTKNVNFPQNTFEKFGIHELSQAQKELDNKISKPHE
jgi:hypothetical protein